MNRPKIVAVNNVLYTACKSVSTNKAGVWHDWQWKEIYMRAFGQKT